MRFDLITIFPGIFESYLSESLVKRARMKRMIDVRTWDLREFAKGIHRKVDDRPFGGGPGMVLMIEPLYRAVQSAISNIKYQKSKFRRRVILFSTRGKKLDARMAKRLSRYDQLILICGRYEGVDERVAKYVADEELSIGDYVLAGGELPALVLLETVSRFLPGFLGKHESLEDVKGSYPVYTRPALFLPKQKGWPSSDKKTRTPRGWAVPNVLLSGDHTRIEEWRTRR